MPVSDERKKVLGEFVDEFLYVYDGVRGTVEQPKILSEDAAVEATKMILMQDRDRRKDGGRQKEREPFPDQPNALSLQKPAERHPAATEVPKDAAPAKDAPRAPGQATLDGSAPRKDLMNLDEAFNKDAGVWKCCPRCGSVNIRMKSKTSGKEYDGCSKCKIYLNVTREGFPAVKEWPKQ